MFYTLKESSKNMNNDIKAEKVTTLDINMNQSIIIKEKK